MSDVAHSAEAGHPPLNALNALNALSALRASGAERFDPVRMQFLEALARRAQSAQGSLRAVIEARLHTAIADLDTRYQAARAEMREGLPEHLRRFPQAAKALQQLADAGDFKALQAQLLRLTAMQGHAPLAELTRTLEKELAKQASLDAPRAELKTLRSARGTWAKLSTQRQFTQALQQAPQNAGPINSHMLMLRSLEMMREISPDYLHRFIAYADTLLRLEPGLADKADKPEKPKKLEKPKKPKEPKEPKEPRTRKPKASPGQD